MEANKTDAGEAEVTLQKPMQLSFWNKFTELQWSMLGLSKDTVEEHVYGSGPMQWIKNDNGVAFWAEKGTNVFFILCIFFVLVSLL